MSVNKAILIGNLGRDPEIRTMPNGNEVASFSLATTDHWKDKTTGERKERTEWHKIVVFTSGLVGIIKSYVKKGTKLYIEGSISTREYEKDGVKRSVTEIVLQGYNCTMQILDNKASGGTSSSSNNNSKSENYDSHYGDVDSGEFIDSISDDEVPF